MAIISLESRKLFNQILKCHIVQLQKRVRRGMQEMLIMTRNRSMFADMRSQCVTSELCPAARLIIIWLLHNLVEASFDLFRYLLLGDQLNPWELHPLVKVVPPGHIFGAHVGGCIMKTPWPKESSIEIAKI